jgi:Tol biopolymer transport system component
MPIELTRRARSTVAALVAAACALSTGAAFAASLPADATALLSGAPSLFEALPAPAGTSDTASTSVSQDGRYVAFESRSDGLLEGDDDRQSNIYVKDRVTGSVMLASRSSGAAGEPAHVDCTEPAISDDGSRVAFMCFGALDPADTNAASDVYVRDIPSASTILVSRAGGLGPVGNQGSDEPRLNATGEYVAFASNATNLDPDATSGQKLYRRQIGGANATIVVSRRPAAIGNQPVDAANDSSISDDGNRIAFTNPGGDQLDPADTNGFGDVYVRDVAAGTTVLASRAPGAGAAGNGPSRSPALAGDGSAVAFQSTANSFDHDEDADTGSDIYWRSLVGTTNQQNTALVSINAAGDKGNESFAPSIDDSGSVVGFLSQATGLDPADTGTSTDAYVKNVATNALYVVSRADGTTGAVANADANAVAVSGDGTKVASALRRGITPDVDPRLPSVVLRDLTANPQRTVSIARPAGTAPFVNLGGPARAAALSADGRYAAFFSGASGLGLPDGVQSAIFVRDRVTGAVTLVSRADGADGAAFTRVSSAPAISADGRRVAFAASDDAQSPSSIWVRDVGTARSFLASRADGAAGAAGNGSSFSPALDADGSRVSFESVATNLGDGDTDALLDVHLRDLEIGRTILVSRGDGTDGPKGNLPSGGSALSADGTRVSFVSDATNLGDGDTDNLRDAHLRDLAAGTTRLVSATPAGVKGNDAALRTSINAAGTRVVFDSAATNLLDATQPKPKVFVRDFAADTLILASRADGADGAPPDGEAFGGVISPDGGYVAFTSDAGNLGEHGPAGVREVYRRDLVAGRTRLASRRAGPTGDVAQYASLSGSISEAGGCVSFSTTDALIGPPSEYAQAYLRTFLADCGAKEPDDTPGGASGSLDVPDTVAPTLTAVRLTRARFRVARAATALSSRIRRGTVLRFIASEPGTLSVLIERAGPGRRPPGGRPACLRVRKLPKHRACTAYRRAGALTRRIAAGAGRVRLTGRLGRRPLAKGRYRLTVTARDAAGNHSRPVRLRFAVVTG